ncbi:lipoate--protein ligase family protein [Haloarchaeobius amylolyticus]|uniref:lipoate--protein ligase family protein n=1 Tax=Haloarchaeobius amylolyticus TaxID=1198296 RepID=UPI00226FB31B|nr:lipoate--protein ligase family protein [Haloarchaeobius amylolyticus]
MRVVRGRAASVSADRDATRRLLDEVDESGEAVVRVWAPHRQVAFGRRDAREEGYPAAAAAAQDHGFEAVERSVGGRAVAYDGETTLAFARITPHEDMRRGMDERYESLTSDVEQALCDLGVAAERGEPADSFCPGQHSLQCDGKLVGIAQRVTKGAAITSGICLVANHDELAAVLDDVYEALGVAFDPESVGSVAKAGGPADPEVVREALEAALVGDAEMVVEQLRA